MKKLRLPMTYVLAALLLICSIGLPIGILRLGDIARFEKVEQEPLPYNLSIEQEPYSTLEKLSLIMHANEEDRVTIATQDLTLGETWSSGFVADIAAKNLAAITSKLGIGTKLEVYSAEMLTLVDRAKPSLSARYWIIQFEGDGERAHLLLDVDTGQIPQFEYFSEGEIKVNSSGVFEVLSSQVNDVGYWDLGENSATFYEENGVIVFHIDSSENYLGWTISDTESYDTTIALQGVNDLSERYGYAK